MTVEAATSVIRGRFNSLITVPYGLPTEFDNAPFTRPENSKWCRWSVLVGGNSLVSIGASTKRFRRVGVAIAQLFSPILLGTKDILQLVDVIEASFRAITVSSVVFTTPFSESIGRDEEEWQTNVTCPFYFDHVA